MTTMNNEGPADPSVHEPHVIGEIVGTRHTTTGTGEFWGYWAEGYKPVGKVRVVNADQMREAIAAERERDYLRWRMREIIPLFEEARDALCAISLVAATAYRVDLSLGSRMDAAGTRTREEFDAMLTAAEKEQPK